MIDPHTLVRAFLLADADLAALIAGRLYAGEDRPPKDYTPDVGPCVCFKVRGGGPDYEDALLKASLQVTCWGASKLESYQTYLAVYDALHNGHSATVLHGESETMGQVLEDEIGWYNTIGYFAVMLRQS